MAKKLSEAQRRMLASVAKLGKRERPFGDGRDIGRLCRAWDRTVESLVDMGLVTPSRTYSHGMAHSIRPAFPWPADVYAQIGVLLDNGPS